MHERCIYLVAGEGRMEETGKPACKRGGCMRDVYKYVHVYSGQGRGVWMRRDYLDAKRGADG